MVKKTETTLSCIYLLTLLQDSVQTEWCATPRIYLSRKMSLEILHSNANISSFMGLANFTSYFMTVRPIHVQQWSASFSLR